VAYTEATISLDGSAFLIPPDFAPNNASSAGTQGNFSPSWQPDAPSGPGGLAYACYRFTADGYDRDPTVRFTWSAAHDVSLFYIAVSDFALNRWDIYPGPASGILALTQEQFDAAIDPASHTMLVVPILGGTDPWVLANIRLGAMPQPDVAGVTPLSGSSGDSVTMQVQPAADSGPISQYQWNFAGGATPNTSANPTPLVVLGAIGTYNATVRCTNPTGQVTYHFTLEVVAGLPAPQITAVAPLTGAPDATVTFGATNSGGAADTWAWDFGGGATPGTSTDEAPEVQLTSTEDVYHCSVTATNATGSSTFNFDLTVVTPPPAPQVNQVLPPIGTAGHPTQFTADTSGGGPVDTWAWDFGGGATPNTSMAASPLVTLAAAGMYDASLTVANGGGQMTYNFHLNINPDVNGAPLIQFVNPTSADPGTTVTFIPTYFGEADTWSWDFGGAATPNTSTDATPQVTLTGDPGQYIVQVSASGPGGAGPPHFFQFTINTPPPPPPPPPG
jgi:PKD repeat protein